MACERPVLLLFFQAAYHAINHFGCSIACIAPGCNTAYTDIATDTLYCALRLLAPANAIKTDQQLREDLAL